MLSIEEQLKIISKGVEEIINVEDLKRKLSTGRQLVVKLGLDPSAPDIHLGHTVVLRKMRQFQDLGHKVIIIIGDFTGMIGDPTGKSKARKQLTREEVLLNAKTYKEQIFKVLNKEKTEVLFNSEWLSRLTFKDIIEITSKHTVARMLEREDFKKRFSNHQSIGIHEFFYPLMQAYDSVSIKADVELGGTEQRFNILMGRTMQKDFDMKSQVAIFMPLLEGIDGKEKMSKSLGNYIGIDEEANEIYGKVMSIPDELIIRYFELTTDIHPDKLENIKKKLDGSMINPRDVKMDLAREIVELYHGNKMAIKAEEHFKRVFQKRLVPEDLQKVCINGQDESLVSIIMLAGFAKSNSEARRLIEQRAVRINDRNVTLKDSLILESGDILRVGKRKFAKIVLE
ncbi:tyrosine--tRNA ligase [Wukongibacter sp. M2B1]|uniref:tyrosine--tRNA ligase n=1 Tax=Wukongibacter sp. M2B1 TaxID=3088895 RepID=UPI003D79934C